jgi:hypothetical protein
LHGSACGMVGSEACIKTLKLNGTWINLYISKISNDIKISNFNIYSIDFK